MFGDEQDRSQSIRGRIMSRLFGRDTQQYATRFLLFIIAVSALVAFAGLFLIFAGSVEVTASSSWVVRLLADIVTNFALFSVLAVIVVLIVLKFWWHFAARKTADMTRYSVRTVKRLAAEAKTTDGTTRLIGNEDHSEAQLRAKLMRAFAGQATDESPGTDEAVVEAPPEQTDTAIEDAETIRTRLEEREATSTAADQPTDGKTFAQILAVIADLPPAAQEVAIDLRRGRIDADLLALELEDAGYVADHGRPLPDTRPDDGDEASSDHTAEPDTPAEDADGVDDSALDSFADLRRAIQTARMDIAATLNYSEIFWRFGLPAIATIFLAFTVAGTPWFSPWVYPILIAISTAVGATSYLTFKWGRRRSARALRADPETKRFRTAVALVKRVDTPEQTMFVAWVAGKVYADYDKHRLASKVADRWHARLNGETVYPAIQEKFARNIQQMVPMIHQFEYGDPHEGRKGMMDDIVSVVSDARDPDGMVPKFRLAEEVVEKGEGVGHDPDLVAEVYEEMVPYHLAETEMTITDADGTKKDITAVHLREMDVPDDLGRIRAQFSNQFVVDEIDGYPLPTVEMPGGPRHLVGGSA